MAENKAAIAMQAAKLAMSRAAAATLEGSPDAVALADHALTLLRLAQAEAQQRALEGKAR